MEPTEPLVARDRRSRASLAPHVPGPSDRAFEVATWAFVALGILLRVGRYLLDYPLWWDEAFVAVNLLRRDYRDLLRPLDYGQVCPLLFLWAERAAVRLLGFSESGLRLFPMVCGIASVVVFHWGARRVTHGSSLLLAVAIFAVSFHPIRHAADVKPYASDLFVAVSLLALALAWWRDPQHTRWLWMLAVWGPISVALSHPAIFVASGVVLALAPAAYQAGGRTRLAFVSFSLATAGSFLFLFAVFTRAQAAATLPAMSADWARSFPPLSNPIALARWLLETHAGNMLAYPCGGARGASSVTLLLCIVAAVALIRRGRGSMVAICLAPFAMGMIAAALGRYPYGGSDHGGSTRFMQYLAPSICLLAGCGAGIIVDQIADVHRRARVLTLVLCLLGVIGIAPIALELPHPFRSVHAARSREFARRFWPTIARGAEVACLRWDLNVAEWNSTRLGIPVALCNQAIYSPPRRHDPNTNPRWAAISREHPLRCVLVVATAAEERAAAAWLWRMRERFELRDHRVIVANMAEPHAPPRRERYVVFEFVPRAIAQRFIDAPRSR